MVHTPVLILIRIFECDSPPWVSMCVVAELNRIDHPKQKLLTPEIICSLGILSLGNLAAEHFQVEAVKQPYIHFILITILFPSSGFYLKKSKTLSLLTLTPATARFDKFTLKEVRRLAGESAFHQL